jgi:YgiT-type zinc finger domain-containing protein
MDGKLFQEALMKCAICRNGITEEGYTTVVLEREQTTLVFKRVPAEICNNCGEETLVFKRVPAEICNNCGEEYISSEVNKALLRHARKELNRCVTLEMLNFAA